jgi:hypothetical protein
MPPQPAVSKLGVTNILSKSYTRDLTGTNQLSNVQTIGTTVSSSQSSISTVDDEIHGTLGQRFAVPFVSPVPPFVIHAARILTRQSSWRSAATISEIYFGICSRR